MTYEERIRWTIREAAKLPRMSDEEVGAIMRGLAMEAQAKHRRARTLNAAFPGMMKGDY